MFALLYLLY
ncbi:hypothetical protein CGLO_00048 [Colletotrichum gloeosporioides Cg-14]|uniref:Uncharacterized protein n=1 Tax=Colletotrichum gloeosporioides (strain Cg-14) TaxID=1237896 RepID=T0M875_COLGC|nr:hypothetical protein CGLO_00048 [Colletotrichum gloeosporioides Cg-14]